MKRIGGIYILFTVLMLAYTNPAEAQFWKRLFKKEEHKRKPVVKKPVAKKTEPPKPEKKKRVIDYPTSQVKTRYRVDVLMPLYLDELVKDDKVVFKGKIPDKATGALDFYEGLKLAADSLSKFNYGIDVYVHDITSTTSSPEKLLAKKELDSADLIIGLVQSNQIPQLAAFAKKKQVNFISALSPSDADVKDNPYFILMQPTLKSHCEYIMERVKKKYKTSPVLMYRTTLGVAEQAYNYLIADADKDMTQVLCNTMPGKEQLTRLFDSTKTNVIVMGIMDNAYAEKMLQQLYDWFPAYQFDIYGMPSWRTMASLKKPDAYPNIATYITSPFYFDGTTAWGQALSNQYKASYGSNRPAEMAYRGYETMYWYAQLLKKYGTIFNEKMSDNSTAPFTKYEVKPEWDDKNNLLYLENTKVYMMRYQSSSYMIEP